MSGESDIVTPQEKPAEKRGGSAPPQPVDNKSPFAAVNELIKLAGSAYAIGFVVIMVHTARLHAPVVEALQFQNFVAGLPVWLPLCGGIWLWPRLIRRFRSPEGGAKFSTNWRELGVLGAGICLVTVILYNQLRWITGRSFSFSENLVIISAAVFAALLSIVVQLLRSRSLRSGPDAAMLETVCVYSGILFLVLAYAILGYPRLPQTIGGGSPVPVQLFFKEAGMRDALGESPAPPSQNPPSDSVLLYYRTSSYLLVSGKEGTPLVQIPIEQLRAVIWLSSRAE